VPPVVVAVVVVVLKYHLTHRLDDRARPRGEGLGDRSLPPREGWDLHDKNIGDYLLVTLVTS